MRQARHCSTSVTAANSDSPTKLNNHFASESSNFNWRLNDQMRFQWESTTVFALQSVWKWSQTKKYPLLAKKYTTKRLHWVSGVGIRDRGIMDPIQEAASFIVKSDDSLQDRAEIRS